jgi:hypothetical protein
MLVSSTRTCVCVVSILALLVPAAFFSALNPGISATNVANLNPTTNTTIDAGAVPFLNDALRADLLVISRGISIILLVV